MNLDNESFPLIARLKNVKESLAQKIKQSKSKRDQLYGSLIASGFNSEITGQDFNEENLLSNRKLLELTDKNILSQELLLADVEKKINSLKSEKLISSFDELSDKIELTKSNYQSCGYKDITIETEIEELSEKIRKQKKLIHSKTHSHKKSNSSFADTYEF